MTTIRAPSNFDFFLAYAPEDERAATDLYQSLSASHKVFFAPKSLLLGDDTAVVAEQALRAARVVVVLFSRNSKRDYVRDEQVVYALNLLQKDPEAGRVVPLCLDGVTPEYPVTQKVSLIVPSVEHLRHAATQLAELVARLRGQPSPSPVRIDEPFRKLREFTFADQDLFFGRDLDIRDLADELRYRLVVLHGASGTGKTSLLQAGLRPLLEREYAWVEVTLQQETDPVDLIRAEAQRQLAARSDAKPPEDAVEGVLRLARLEERRILLVLDHAEKMFQGQPPVRIQERCQRLAKAISTLLVDGETRSVYVLFALRDDFHGQLRELQQAGLHTIFDHGRLLRPLEISSARRALSEPLMRAGCSISAKLVSRIVEDLCGPEREINPVELQIVADSLYQRARKLAPPAITDDLYKNLGGVGQVLAAYLADKLGGFPAVKRRAAEELLCALIAPGGERSAARTASELAVRVNLDERSTSALIDELVNPLRLLMSDGQDGQAAYRLAHDQVAKAMFARLEEAKREDIKTSSELQPRIAEWKKTPLPSLNLALLSLEQRVAFQKWYERNLDRASPDERRFLAALRRVEMGKRALLAVLILLIPLGTWFWVGQVKKAQRKQHEAERQRIEAQAREAEAKAEQMLQRDPGQALAWIAELARLRGGTEKEDPRYFHQQWLMAMVAVERGIGWPVIEHGKRIQSLAFSPPKPGSTASCPGCWPNTPFLISGGDDGQVIMFDMQKRRATALKHTQQGPVASLSISSDGRWISACIGSSVVKWDAEHLQSEATILSKDTTDCAHTEFSPDGRLLAAASLEDNITIWNTATWETAIDHRIDLGTVQVTSRIMSMRFSPSGQWLAAGFANGDALMLETKSGGHMKFETGLNSIGDLAFSPKEDVLAVSGHPKFDESKLKNLHNIGIFSLPITEKNPKFVPIYEGQGTVARVRFDLGAFMITANQTGEVFSWISLGDIEKAGRINSHNGPVWDLDVSTKHTYVTAGQDGSVQYSPHGNATGETFIWRGHAAAVRRSVFSPDGNWVASASDDGQVRLWNTYAGHNALFGGQHGSVRAIVADNPERVVIGAFEGAAVQFWHRFSSSPTEHRGVVLNLLGLNIQRTKERVIYLHNQRVLALCQMSDDLVISGGDDHNVVIWNKNSALAESSTETGFRLGSIFCATNKRVFLGTKENIVSVDFSDDKREGTTIGKHDDYPAGYVTNLQLMPDRDTLVSVSGKSILTWSIQSNKKLRAFESAHDVWDIHALNEDQVLYGGEEGLIHILNIRTGANHTVGPPIKGRIIQLALSPDRQMVATAGEDGSLRLLWLETGIWESWAGHIASTQAIAFSKDGRYVVSGGGDGRVKVWPLPPIKRDAFADWLSNQQPYQVRDGKIELSPTPKFGLLAEAKQNN